MKLLFLIDGAYNPLGATHNLARRLCNALCRAGNEITILESCYDEQLDKKQLGLADDIKRITFFDAREQELHTAVTMWKHQGDSRLKICARLALRPRLLRTIFEVVVCGNGPLTQSYTKKIEQLDAQNHYDAVVAVSAPHYTSFALLRAKICAKKVAYWLDPYSTNPYSSGSRARRTERALYENFDAFFITDLMLRENSENSLKPYCAKMHALAFPNIVLCEQQETVSADGKTVCLFAGNFYQSIRSPEYLKRLFSRMPPKVVLRVIGAWHESADDATLSEFFKGCGNAEVCGAMPLAQTIDEMRKADVLVNLGNANANQLPSKIYDYISTGKPILNICKSRQCPTIPVLQKYPLSLILFEDDPIEQSAEKVVGFVAATRGRRMKKADIERLYSNGIPANTAREFSRVLEELL